MALKENTTPHGIWLETVAKLWIRPDFKAAVLATAKVNPERVYVENTGTLTPVGNGTHNLDQLPEGTYHFCGPDPYKSKKFYGKVIVTKRNGVRKVSVR